MRIDMGSAGRSAALLALCILGPSLAYAQASIAGSVRDSSGAVLPGVTVEASSPALLEKVRSVVTDGSGQYRIENLRPGTYAVAFMLTGFNTVKREGVELLGSATATVNADMRVGALEETITVTGEASVVDVQNTTRQRVLDHDVLDVIPSGRSERNIANLIPGLSMNGGVAGQGAQDVGGALNDTQGSMIVHGSKSGDHRITQNGVSLATANGAAGNSSQSANLAAYAEVTVDTAAVSAELAQGGPRVNFIPRDGGNTFKGVTFMNVATKGMQGSNYSDDLKNRGLRTPGSIGTLYDINPGFGGPVRKDLLWFFGTIRYNTADNFPAGAFNNLNADKPDVWTYAPDPGSQPNNHIVFKDAQVRLTWQATARNKIGVGWDLQDTCFCSAAISATTAPEAAVRRKFPREYNILGDWTAPLNNRLLLDAALVRRIEYTAQKGLPTTPSSMISVTDQALGNLAYRAISGAIRNSLYKTFYLRGSASYITGSHSFKVGYTFGHLTRDDHFFDQAQPVSYRFNNGVPNLITLAATPYDQPFIADQDSGAYAQDKWTIRRVTVAYGLRLDWFKDSFPAQTLGPGPLVPNRNQSFPAAKGVSWKDLTPKSGVSYDLFGDGRTALKVSLNKYLQGQGSGNSAGDNAFGSALAPAGRVVLSTTRSWNDANRDYVPQCELANPVTNGECGPMASSTFGLATASQNYDPDTLNGWGKRGFNWEFTAGVQRELFPRVSVDVSYFRRWFGNFILTDNRAVAASDFSQFSTTAPATDSRLPNAGNTVTGLFDLNPNKVGQVDNYVTYAKNYGKQTYHWNGADVTINARPRSSVLLQGGTSFGKTASDNCEVMAKVPEMLNGLGSYDLANNNVWMPLQYCHQETKMITQVKMLGAYTVPKIDVQISSTFQSVPGPLVFANYAVPAAVAAASLGRPLSGNAQNITVNLLDPGTLYGERATWLDVRFGKILRYGRTRTAVNIDLFNALNGNPVLQQNNVFGGTTPWQAPQSILIARFFKISGQFDF
jgi:Carboxypeptidase regulatory-like domain